MTTEIEPLEVNRLAHKIIEHVSGQQSKVFIALPIYGGIDPLFFQCCLKLTQELEMKNIHGAIRTHIGDSAVGRARNALTRDFLDSDCTHLLFIDSDLVFGGEQIARIMGHKEEIVGGLYCKKQGGEPGLVLNCLDTVIDGTGKLVPNERREDGLLEVKYIGTGFLRVARCVFERMIEAYSDEISYRCDHNSGRIEYDFWKMGVYKYPDGNKRWLSEDWMMCQRAKDLGFKVWADMAILLKHRGMTTFPDEHQEKILFGGKMALDSASSDAKA